MKKVILSLMLLILFLSLTLSQAIGDMYYSIGPEDFIISVKAPDEAKIDEEFNVNLTIYPSNKIYVESLDITFENLFSIIYNETLFHGKEVSEKFSKNYSLKTKYPGRIWCEIMIFYVVNKGTPYEKASFGMFQLDLTEVVFETRDELEKAYLNYTLSYPLLEKEYEDLKEAHETLKRNYESLETDYENLETNYSNLKSSYSSLEEDYKNLRTKYENLERDYSSLNEELQEQSKMTNALFLTTVIFLTSTIYLEWKIRKIRKEPKKQTGSSIVKEKSLN